MSVAVEAYSSMAQRVEPDVQATLSDFLTYTEHFPAALTRTLTLLQSETVRTEKHVAAIHDATTLYSQLPNLPADERPDPVELRKIISYDMEKAERATRMRVEEATRLAEMAKRESARLDILLSKLLAMPMPSRDPTPEDDGALTSPNLSRTARFSADVVAKPLKRPHDRAATKLRARKIIVPGEVLPPPDPNAPPETFSDWTSSESEAEIEQIALKRQTSRPRSRTPKFKHDRSDREDREKKPPRPRGPRMPGQPGTNAHSAVAGISTSNALLALNPPPPDAPPGSAWLPWLKLTEWEMAKLRKRMKKNAIWVPSATMVRRELKNLGRGVNGREHARAVAEREGRELVDESNAPDPTKAIAEGVEGLETAAIIAPPIPEEDEDADAELINRGMRLNEAKKLKRARLLEEQREASAQIAREQGDSPEATSHSPEQVQRKRKRETTPVRALKDLADESPDVLSRAAPPPTRRIKLNHSAAPDKATDKRKTLTPPPKKPSLILKANKAVSEEPPNRRASLRRGSNASLPDKTPVSPGRKQTTKRGKKPAPGVITGGDDESARVSASRRKAAPRKRNSTGNQAKKVASAAPPEPQVEEEMIDPDEPRYCICGDVSWGTMIQCENEASCEKEWFHLDCVGLKELPPRRTKWYCPDCRKKLKLGQGSNGLVGKAPAR